jgi:hypothetical protein
MFGFRTKLRIKKATHELNNETLSGLNETLCVFGILCNLACFSVLTVTLYCPN